MDMILLIRLAITATFLILALGGPIAIVMNRRFLKRYLLAHEELVMRVDAIERRIHTLEA